MLLVGYNKTGIPVCIESFRGCGRGLVCETSAPAKLLMEQGEDGSAAFLQVEPTGLCIETADFCSTCPA